MIITTSKECRGISCQKPIWEPGTKSGYHSLTYGWLVSEIILRTTGKTLGQYFKEKIATPNEIDFFIGLPESEEQRVAEMVPFPKTENKEVVNKENNEAKKLSDRGPNLLNNKTQELETSRNSISQWSRLC